MPTYARTFKQLANSAIVVSLLFFGQALAENTAPSEESETANTHQQRIYHPVTIGNRVVANPIWRSSLAGVTDPQTGVPTEARAHFEQHFARGGAGLIISSHVPIDARNNVLPNYAMLWSRSAMSRYLPQDPQQRAAALQMIDKTIEEQVTGWKTLVDGVHNEGSQYFMQLSLSGRQRDVDSNFNLSTDKELTWPHAPVNGQEAFHGVQGKPQTDQELTDTVKYFVEAGRLAKRAGVDGLELHSANGYFFTQLLGNATNDRGPESRYGGPLENRFRFLGEVVQALKADPETKDLPLIVKLSVKEDTNALKPWVEWIPWLRKRRENIGNTLEESQQIAKWAVEAGADAIHVSAGNTFPAPSNPKGYMDAKAAALSYPLVREGGKTRLNNLLFRKKWLHALPRLGWEFRNRNKLYPTFGDYLRGRRPAAEASDASWRKLEGSDVEASRAIKQAVAGMKTPQGSVPKVLLTGNWQTLEGVESGLGRDYDVITSARMFLANRDLPNQLMAASMKNERGYAPKNPCSGCNACLFAAPRMPPQCASPERFAGRANGPQATADLIAMEGLSWLSAPNWGHRRTLPDAAKVPYANYEAAEAGRKQLHEATERRAAKVRIGAMRSPAASNGVPVHFAAQRPGPRSAAK